MDDINRNPETTQRTSLHIDPSDPVDVLSWIPFQLGFWPHESLVVVALRRASERVQIGLVARFDLAELARDPGLRYEVERQLVLEDAVGALCVVASNQPWMRTSRSAGGAGAVLSWWLRTQWAAPERTWLLSDAAFRCVQCEESPCCPAAGRPTAVLKESEVTATMVFHGRSYAMRRDALIADVERTAPGRRAASAAATRHDRRRAQTDPTRWRRLAMRQWGELTERVTARPGQDVPTMAIEPTLLGAVLAGLADEWVRDGVLLWAATGRVVTDRERSAVLEALFAGGLGPDQRRLAAAHAALTLLATHATRRWRVPVLGTAAWLAWWGGDGARASLLLERMVEIDPAYPLARLLGAVVGSGVPPGWAREPRSA